jgi:hypothetical protein
MMRDEQASAATLIWYLGHQAVVIRAVLKFIVAEATEVEQEI